MELAGAESVETALKLGAYMKVAALDSFGRLLTEVLDLL